MRISLINLPPFLGLHRDFHKIRYRVFVTRPWGNEGSERRKDIEDRRVCVLALGVQAIVSVES